MEIVNLIVKGNLAAPIRFVWPPLGFVKSARTCANREGLFQDRAIFLVSPSAYNSRQAKLNSEVLHFTTTIDISRRS
jgi:hypothetical protein